MAEPQESTPDKSSEKPLTGWALLKSDAERLGRLGAKIGAALAVLCHLLPPHFRPICDALSSVCTGGH